MILILLAVLPVFGVIATGAVFGRLGTIGAEGARAINTFCFYAAVPALLFRIMVTRLPEVDLQAGILLAYYVPAVAIFGVVCTALRVGLRVPLADAGMLAMGASFSNTVLIGIPIAERTLGPDGVLACLVIVSVHPLVMGTLPVIAVETGLHGRAAGWRAVLAVLRGIATNPVILSMTLGLVYALLGFGIPEVVDDMLALLGRAATPAALFLVGVTVATARADGHGVQAVVLSAIKLVVHPLLVWVAATFVLNLPPLWVAAATLIAGLPTGVSVTVFARRYGVQLVAANRLLLLTTTAAVVTLTLLLGQVAPPVLP